MNNTIKYSCKAVIFALLLCVGGVGVMSSCDDDDAITEDRSKIFTLFGSNLPMLDSSSPTALALTLYWSYNPNLASIYSKDIIPRYGMKSTVEISGTEDFAQLRSFALDEKTDTKQFTAAELNETLLQLGFQSGQQQTMYVRIAAIVGDDLGKVCSNVMQFTVTPY